jgi:hypothetical protein
MPPPGQQARAAATQTCASYQRSICELTATDLLPRHGRLEIDYVLTTYALDFDHLELVLQTPHFRLYRDHRLDLVTDP